VIPKKGPNGKPTKKQKSKQDHQSTLVSPARPSSKKPKNIMEDSPRSQKIEEEMAQKQLKLKKFPGERAQMRLQ